MKKIIIFLGAPGSGKGTQAKNLAKKFGYFHLSTGELLRALGQKADLSAEEKKELENLKIGHLVSDELIYRLAFEKLGSLFENNHGVVLDGAIRSLDQAKEYQKFFKSKGKMDEVIVIEVAISAEESLKRLTARQRTDDNPETINRRLRVQGNEAIAPIRNYYQALGLLRKVDGMKSIQEVFKEIEKVLM
ncbi:MAG: nucleoside monophosphate kinase [Patescibacteria group bacterium]